MKKIFLVLLFIVSSFATEIEIYEVTDNKKLKKISRFNLINKDYQRYIGVTNIDNKIYIEQAGVSNEYIYDIDGKLISKNKFMKKSSNSCVNVYENDELYKTEQIFKDGKTSYILSKKNFNDKKWNVIDTSLDDSILMYDSKTIVKQKNNYKNNSTTLFQKELGSKNWNKLFTLKKMAYIHDLPIDDTYAMLTLNSNGKHIFYKVKDGKSIELGEVKLEDYKISHFTIFNNQPELLFFKDKIVYKLADKKMNIVKNFSNDKRLDYLMIDNDITYGIKLIN